MAGTSSDNQKREVLTRLPAASLLPQCIQNSDALSSPSSSSSSPFNSFSDGDVGVAVSVRVDGTPKRAY